MLDYSKAQEHRVPHIQMQPIRSLKQKFVILNVEDPKKVGDVIKIVNAVDSNDFAYFEITNDYHWGNARIASIDEADMEHYQLQYNSVSFEYPEDNWTEKAYVTSSEDVYEFLKHVYLRDAANRAEYPTRGHIVPTAIKYHYQTYKPSKGKANPIKNYELNRQSMNAKFQAGIDMFEKWEKRVKSFIPRLREKQAQLEKEDAEYQTYLSLKSKFGE